MFKARATAQYFWGVFHRGWKENEHSFATKNRAEIAKKSNLSREIGLLYLCFLRCF